MNSTSSRAHFKITFFVKQTPLQHSDELLFIAGNFNNWNPADTNFAFKTNKKGMGKTTMLLSGGDYEYKFTRGNWDKVETESDGENVPNRKLVNTGDVSVYIRISGWKDDFATTTSAQKVHTVSPNVTVINDFFIPQFNRYRRIWVYLPPGYKKQKNRLPVLYMHDGQNLFDEATSFAGEWGVDEYLDSISRLGKKEVIVVGIDNGLSKRRTEYNPFTFQQFGKGGGDKYVDFLVNILKPFIDKNYYTLPDKKNTFIAGSSLGGLITLYAVLKYPEIFGGAGIFSPSFFTAPGIDNVIIAESKYMNSRLFFYAGGEESDSMVADMKRVEKEIKKYSKSKIKEDIDYKAAHNEVAWRKYFPMFYNWEVLSKEK